MSPWSADGDTVPVGTRPGDAGRADVDGLVFAARALAQTHPMTEGALRYRQERFAQERARQPAAEAADWAGTALLVGYCLRRAEERLADARPEVRELGPAAYAARAASVAEALGTGDPSTVTLLPGGTTVAALDRLIGSELAKREEHVREQLDDDAWAELESYIAWWVVHGYGVRSVEAVP